jgi:hypothetical protein
MYTRISPIALCLLVVFTLGCAGAKRGGAVDATSEATKPFFDKPDAWTTAHLLNALRDHLGWSSDVVWAMATVDAKGKPNISAILPYAVRDDVLVFANRQSAARTNVETTGLAHGFFRAVDAKTIDPKRYDYFGVVGNRLLLEIVADPRENDILWQEYKALKTPVSPPGFGQDDHFFMKIVAIEPIG